MVRFAHFAEVDLRRPRALLVTRHSLGGLSPVLAALKAVQQRLHFVLVSPVQGWAEQR